MSEYRVSGTRKRKGLVAFVVLKLLVDANSGVKREKSRKRLRDQAEKRLFPTAEQLSLEDDTRVQGDDEN